MSRISRDEMFMRIAHVVALRGTCNRAQVGAVLVTGNRVVSIGYNGSLPGEPHCDDIGHMIVDNHCVRTVHAEVNAIDFAEEHDWGPGNLFTLYVTHMPCYDCCKKIADSYLSITRVVYDVPYGSLEDQDDKIALLNERGINLAQYSL